MIDFLRDQNTHAAVMRNKVLFVNHHLWIATSDLKDLHITYNNKIVPFSGVLADLLKKENYQYD